jgi:hypothetical protein
MYGMYKSTNGGDSWSAVNNGMTNKFVNALVIDPADSLTLYAATNGGGVFKSENGGGLWSEVNTGLNSFRYVNALAIDQATPQTLYAGTNGGGVFISTDGGGSWSAVNTNLTNVYVNTLAIGATTPLSVYAGTSGGGVYKSIDGGGSWSEVNSGLGNNYGYISRLAMDPVTPQIVYAGTTAAGVFRGISDPIPPGAPFNVTATAGDGRDTVTFNPPQSDGGSPITSYTVIANPGGISASGPSSPMTVTGLTNSIPYTFTLFATNDLGAGLEASAATNLYGVGVTINGGGSVYSSSSGTICTSGSCQYNATADSTIILTQSAANGSQFISWGGACSGAGPCSVTLNTLYRSVTATFDPLPNARILGSPQLYGLLQSAYDVASGGAVIQARGITFTEELTTDRAVDLTMEGGYDSGFSLRNGDTILQGMLTVARGSVVLDRLTIK